MMRNQNKALKTVLIVCILRRSLYIYLRSLITERFNLSCSLRSQAAEVNFLLPNNFTRFSKVPTRIIFTFFQPQPELVLKLFLTFGQSEPNCSYKVVLMKKSV